VSRKTERREVLRQLFAAPDGRATPGNIIETDPHYRAAIEAAAPFVLTLDKALETKVNAAGLPVQALAPGAFIKTILPKHVDYPAIR